MQQRRQQFILFIVVLLCVSGGAVLASLHGQNQGSTSQRQHEIDTSQFPIVDSTDPLPTDPIKRGKRETKNRRYNSRYSPPIGESNERTFCITDWEVGLPALPVAKSAAVIIGEVTTAEAHLSEDKTAVYSEFGVRIDEVLKTDPRNPQVIGSTLFTERIGGRVRLGSGRIAVYQVDKQDMPSIGKRYVIFLTHGFPLGGETDDFYILTGYELRSGRIFPLDNLRPGHPITKYEGADEVSFRNDLQVAVAKATLTIQAR